MQQFTWREDPIGWRVCKRRIVVQLVGTGALAWKLLAWELWLGSFVPLQLTPHAVTAVSFIVVIGLNVFVSEPWSCCAFVFFAFFYADWQIHRSRRVFHFVL